MTTIRTVPPDTTSSQAFARRASRVGIAGGCLLLIYGALAIAFPHPTIVEPAFEAFWAVLNLGMIAGILGWTALDVARSRRVARIGASVAVAGHVLRFLASILIIAVPSVDPEPLILSSIGLMYLGLVTLGVTTLRGRRLTGWRAGCPFLVVATGFVTAAVYQVDPVIHFVLLGLLWGPAWLLLSGVVRNVAAHPS